LQEHDQQPQPTAHTQKPTLTQGKEHKIDPKTGVLSARILKPQKNDQLFIYRGTLKEIQV
jgi:hypothetical protein